MKEFDKRYIMCGDLKGGDIKFGRTRCELVTNKVDTSSMKATFSVFSGDFSMVAKHLGSNTGFNFDSTMGNESIRVTGDLPELNIESYNDELLKVSVASCEIHRREGAKPGDKLIAQYFVMPAYTYGRTSGTEFKHWSKGLLFGWNGWRKDWGVTKEGEQEKEWSDESFTLSSLLGSSAMMHTLLFHDEETESRKTYKIVDQLMVRFEVDGPFENVSALIDGLNKEMEDILLALSLIEGEFIDWSYCSISIMNSDKKPQEEFELYQRARKRESDSTRKSFFTNNGSSLRRTHAQMVSEFQKQKKDFKDAVRNIMDRFIIACRRTDVDTEVIYLHSCLDVIIKFFNIQGGSFSKRLLKVCQQNHVEWKDIYSSLTEECIEYHKGDFPINKIRNDMLHDGIYPNDYTEIFNARALCERLILKILGIDYKDSGLGSVNIR